VISSGFGGTGRYIPPILVITKKENEMKPQKITPSIIRSAKIQTMTPEAFVSGLTALQASINRSKLAK